MSFNGRCGKTTDYSSVTVVLMYHSLCDTLTGKLLPGVHEKVVQSQLSPTAS